MKEFATARFVRSIAVAGTQEDYVAADKGFAILHDGGPLLLVKKGAAETLVPWTNVVCVTAKAEPKKK